MPRNNKNNNAGGDGTVDDHAICQTLFCKKTLSAKIIRPLSVKALICKNSCGPYLQKALILQK